MKLNASKKQETKILVFGTFDVLHKGHLHFFKQARKLSANPYLIVSVARDVNVKKIKGRKPLSSEKQRLAIINKNRLVNKAVLGATIDYLGHIVSLKPDILALGYDQTAYTQNLKNRLKKIGLRVKVARLKPYHPKIYKSSLVRGINRFA